MQRILSGGLWRTLWLFQGQITLSEYSTVRVLCDGEIGHFWKWFFPCCSALSAQVSHYTMRTADGSRGSASGLSCFNISYMLQALSRRAFQLFSAWKWPLHRCRIDTQLFASSIVFFLVYLHFFLVFEYQRKQSIDFEMAEGSSIKYK